MSRTDLLPSICLSALLAVSTTGATVAASPMQKPVLLPVVRVINQKPEAPAAEPAAPAAAPAAEPAAPAAPAPTSGADFGFDIQIPTVATVNSSMSATELTRALSGGLASEADKLALTTPDRRFTVRTVACFGQCALAPVVEVNHHILSHVNERSLQREIKALKQETK